MSLINKTAVSKTMRHMINYMKEHTQIQVTTLLPAYLRQRMYQHPCHNREPCITINSEYLPMQVYANDFMKQIYVVDWENHEKVATEMIEFWISCEENITIWPQAKHYLNNLTHEKIECKTLPNDPWPYCSNTKSRHAPLAYVIDDNHRMEPEAVSDYDSRADLIRTPPHLFYKMKGGLPYSLHLGKLKHLNIDPFNLKHEFTMSVEIYEKESLVLSSIINRKKWMKLAESTTTTAAQSEPTTRRTRFIKKQKPNNTGESEKKLDLMCVYINDELLPLLNHQDQAAIIRMLTQLTGCCFTDINTLNYRLTQEFWKQDMKSKIDPYSLNVLDYKEKKCQYPWQTKMRDITVTESDALWAFRQGLQPAWWDKTERLNSVIKPVCDILIGPINQWNMDRTANLIQTWHDAFVEIMPIIGGELFCEYI